MPSGPEIVGVLFLATGASMTFFLRKPLRYPEKPGSKALVVTIIGCALWPLSLGVGYFFSSLEVSTAAWSFRVLAASIISAGWFLLVIDFTNAKLPSRRLIAALAAYVLVEAALLATNSFHHVVLRPDTVVQAGVLEPAYGPWFWTQATVNYVLMLAATVLLAVESIRSSGLYRAQTIVLALAPLPPVAANLVTILGIVDVGHDLTPFGLVGSGFFLTWALYRAEFLSLVPIARQTAMEEMHDAVVTVDGEDRIVDCNAAARRLFEVDADYYGMPVAEFFSPVPDRTLRRFADVTDVETTINTPTSGGDRHFELSISPIGTDRNEEVGRVVVLRDVTDRKRRERQLVVQNESLDEFASVVSHDVQGPLMTIRGSADLAERTGNLEYLDHVRNGADRIERLADDLLRLARDGRRVDEPDPVSLEAVAETAWLSVRNADAELDVRSDQTVLADGARLQQLLDNLFRNAVEHGSTSRSLADAREDAVEHGSTSRSEPQSDSEDAVEHGSTSRSLADAREDAVEQRSTSPASSPRQDAVKHDSTIRSEPQSGPEGASERESPDVRITVEPLPNGFAVEDDGPGIPPGDRDRVFDRGVTGTGGGSGLGLEIVRQIVEAHGWRISVTEGSTGGARFEITGVEMVPDVEQGPDAGRDPDVERDPNVDREQDASDRRGGRH